MTTLLQPGKLVSLRGREWIVLPSEDNDLLIVKPLGGSDDEITGIYLPLAIESDQPADARFEEPTAADLGDISTARVLYDSARLAFRNGAGPFRALAKLSFRPRSYQMVPLIMALRQESVRLLIADDVGVGKTVEALLIVRELLERRKISRFAVICLPHLCEQWQTEIRAKLDLEAVIIRSNTQARLDRQIQGDTSVYDYYPYQVISVDFIKSDVRRDVFVEQCPELVIVDETHTCARPTGASASQQQRYHLVSRIAAKPGQQLILLTATPHSGKPEEFHSLLGLLRPEFETLDLPNSTQADRRELARVFVQRKRADVEKWMGENTPFPEREAFEWPYDLSSGYSRFFEAILDFARKLIAPDPARGRQQRVQYWTALALLRGVMSSPAAGIEMLNTRLSNLASAAGDDAETSDNARETEENPVGDTEFGFEGDNAPTQIIERNDWTEHQRRRLRDFAQELAGLSNIKDDSKLASAELILDDWLSTGFNPVVFCRYIATANYVSERLAPALKKKFPKLDLQVITSELPDELRKQRIEEMGRSPRRVLIATDCLSEGVNLQEHFTGVLHYDLPWNPNRLEQREGRVDRFGQLAPKVKACLLYGADNPIDGIVLDVLLRKVREIKRATGINVPFPEDSQSIIDTITQALLLNPARHIEKRRDKHQIQFDFGDFDEAATAKANVTRKVDEAAEREKASRSIFAQNAIKAQEIEADLREVDEAIGDPMAVEEFVSATLNNVLGVEIRHDRKGYRIVTGNLPPSLRELLPAGEPVKVSFQSPTPEGYHYIGRNHRFVEQLCQLIMANTLARVDKRAARAAVVRTRQVATKTTLLLFRCRNVIEQSKAGHKIVAEEMLLWGWRGTPQQKEFLDHAEAKKLLAEARASSDLSPQARAGFLENELTLLTGLRAEFDAIAEQQSKRLVDAHERFSALMDRQRFQVVYPVLPMDLLGVYILLPDGGQR
ncbi:RNA polymerase-associated protein RapA [Candidatus Methylomirabilis lanthanidiphila]|uniref:RNA polymerase-associated protein RapA n=1 Tax=Candidatus Methylomirabilis lanthanidiphila TaxID=2211376 RepID=A0A564ZK02_9BACT|nr:DEAD/DEAH box helicase [Candidatus Methylomirabilis lanthanidiphila]VUZ85670.1 RNA polymerase-associated protein RapA [Candidatus Methylomirabilis lanthanidiphila]